MFLVKDVIYNNIYNIFIKICICYYDICIYIYIILIAYSIKDDVIIDNSSTTINLVKLLQQDRSTKMRGEREINLSLIKGCDILIPKTVKNNTM